jgi:hypothetical protein
MKRKTGVNKVNTRSLWGACALAWRREMLEKVVESAVARNWLGAGPGRKKRELRSAYIERRNAWYEKKRTNPETIANSDTAIGKAVIRLKASMWFIDPSPVSHISTFSTLSHGGNGGNRNCFRCADHSKPLRGQVFESVS